MAPVNLHATATVLSTSVVSHDRESVLIEPGSFTPMRWFLERAANATHKDAEEPPQKRRKLAKEVSRSVQHQDDQEEHITISQIAIDLHFPETLQTKAANQTTLAIDVDFSDGEESDVVPQDLKVDDDGHHGTGSRLTLAVPGQKGAVLIIDMDAFSKPIAGNLRQLLFPELPRYDKHVQSQPATTLRCTLTRSNGQLYSVVRFRASLQWRSGCSAFPAGLPVGRARVYPDYDVLVQHYPDHGRGEVDHSQAWSPHDFYESVHVPSRETDTTEKYNEVLESVLYPFQKRAVTWMLRREGVVHDRQTLHYLQKSHRQSEQLSLYSKIQDAEGQSCFVNHVQGTITRHRPDTEELLSGGLLAEEMGLGKTVELMALVALHKRQGMQETSLCAVGSGDDVPISQATLIISPSSILEQWKSELGRHAPSLTVFHYDGVPPGTKKSRTEDDIIRDLTTKYDVILTTYQVLRREVHFAEDPPERNMRHSRKFERKRSPLVRIQWWRIVLDEAQMVESGVTAAARVACRLPRVHSWAVSGTPLKKNVEDLQGLLLFLRYQPFSDNSRLWSHLITNHRHLFRRIFGQIALRHTKAQVREELRLPSQKRVVITMPFSAVEQQHYTTLFTEMCEEVGVSIDGFPITDQWDPENSTTIETMRSWLTRLRQTCLHPQVGTRNRRALGRGQGPLRTVAEVLEVMIEQNETSVRVEERAVIASKLRRAHIIANNKEDDHRSEKALEIYTSAMAASQDFVSEARERLRQAEAIQVANGEPATETEDEDSSSETTPLLGKLKHNLRFALQLQHVCCFFAATSYFQIKANPVLTQPDTNRFRELEGQEVALYDNAKLLRREILKDTSRKADSFVRKIKGLQAHGGAMKMPVINDLNSSGGIESRRIVEKSYALFDLIADQSKLIAEWSTRMADYLVKPLVDEDEGNETIGDEYEESTKQQDELYVYFDVLKALRADLNTCITGETAPLMDHEAKMLVRDAKSFLDPENDSRAVPHAPELLLKLMALRNELKARLVGTGSVRGLIQESRTLENSMEWQVGTRQDSERHLIRQHLGALQKIFGEYSKALTSSEKVVDLFRSTQNQRIAFYRQLQDLSDAVAPHKDELDEQLDLTELQAAIDKEQHQTTALQVLKTRQRFLYHLREDATPEDCVICRSPITTGVITVCAHQYCKECIHHWWQQHRTCPVCKRRLALVDFHDITYKPKELRAQEETQPGTTLPHPISPSKDASIYSGIDTKLMDEIKSIDLPSSYGTKIDTLGRHLHWIREHDPGAKSIVFSQYREFLDVLGSALSEFKLGHSRLGRPGAVERFRHDASIDCLLLDAKTDSSGLTLVNATHVFICEPLIQTAVELQAIARVHRIGQTRATTVWMYLINDTVEEAIYELSVARRVAHVQSQQQEQEQVDKSRSHPMTPSPAGPVLETTLDAVNSAELQSAPLAQLLVGGKSGGEMVGKQDLWRCLFGKSGAAAGVPSALQAEVDRHARAEAVEQRQLSHPQVE